MSAAAENIYLDEDGHMDPRQTPSQEITLGERLASLEAEVRHQSVDNAARDERAISATAELRAEVRTGFAEQARIQSQQSQTLERIANVEERRERRTEEIWTIVKRILIGAGSAGAGGGILWQLLGN